MWETNWKDVAWVAVVMIITSFTICYVATIIVKNPPPKAEAQP